MADPVTEGTAGELPGAALERVEPAAAEPPAPPPRSPYRRRFAFVYACLGAVVGAAAVALVLLLVDAGGDSGPPWSAWQPDGDPNQQVAEIASYVGGRYHLPGGQQLVGIEASPLRVQETPVSAVAVRRPPGAFDTTTPATITSASGTIGYLLCGFGDACSIAEGQPTPERGRLVRREILELALYTFRYVDGVDAIVGFFPPRKGAQPETAVYLEKAALGPELDRPLAQTLSPRVPLPGTIRPSEIETIDALTEAQVFRFRFQPLQDGTAALVLDDLRLPVPQTTTAPADTAPADTAPAETGASTGAGG
jgi:hypothetical protein